MVDLPTMMIWEPPRRRGRFTIAFAAVSEQPELVMQVLQGLIIIRCEARFDRGHFEYVAVGRPFRELSMSDTTPDYDVILGENDNNPCFFAGFRERTPTNGQINIHEELRAVLGGGAIRLQPDGGRSDTGQRSQDHGVLQPGSDPHGDGDPGCGGGGDPLRDDDQGQLDSGVLRGR